MTHRIVFVTFLPFNLYIYIYMICHLTCIHRRVENITLCPHADKQPIITNQFVHQIYCYRSKYLEAAATFTEALDCIESYTDDESESNSLTKQIVTLINNRSAMYEKGNLPELAVEDCNKILEVYDLTHVKARQRKLRILENKFKDYYQALVECCALQLQYMQQHKDQLRLGLPPSAPPPVQQEKLEELVQKIVPEQLEEYDQKIIQKIKENPQLPSDYTISQLLKSYTGYSSWTAEASSGKPASEMEKEVEDLLCKPMEDAAAIADVASLWMKIGRRHVLDGNYSMAREAILKGYGLVEDDVKVQSVMKDDDYARLLEWTGMVKHWAYELDAAIKCYKKCADLEPLNVGIIKSVGFLIRINRLCGWLWDKS